MPGRLISLPVSRLPATLEDYRSLSPADRALLIRSSAAQADKAPDIIRLLVMLGRPRTCVPGLLAYVLGFSYTRAPFSPAVVLGALLALLIGFSANLHNTYTDLEEDARNLPGRGWLLARFGMRRLLVSLVVIDIFMIASAAVIGAGFLIVMTLAVIGLHQYSFPPLRMKARPVLGLYVFAQAVVFPFIFGWLTARPLSTLLSRSSYVAMMLFLFLWFVAKGMFKNVPDFYGDGAVGLRTSATVFPTWRAAAVAATTATMAGYLCPVVIVGLGFAPIRLLGALVWLPVAVVQCRRLVAADDATAGNDILRADMLVSSGFLATVLLLCVPASLGAGAVVAGGLVLLGSDRLHIDSRRPEDSADSLRAAGTRDATVTKAPPGGGNQAMPAELQAAFPQLVPDLRRVREEMRRAATDADRRVREPLNNLLTRPGRFFRPSLTLMAAYMTTGSMSAPAPEAAVRAGAAVELLHVATLYHDDVIDEADTRRGVPTLNARFGNGTAILSGDYLLACCMRLVSRISTRATKTIADTLRAMCAGQIIETADLFATDRSEDSYFAGITGKTASLLGASAELGAMTAGASPAACNAFGAYARHLGLAFQIWDDIRDIRASVAGKPACKDIQNGVYTLPVIYGMRAVPDKMSPLLGDRGFGSSTERRITDVLERSGALDRAAHVAELHVRQAFSAAADLSSVLPGTGAAGRLDMIARTLIPEIDSLRQGERMPLGAASGLVRTR